jgi:hypothetical protein
MEKHTIAEFALGVVRVSRTPFGYHVWSDFEPTESTSTYTIDDAWTRAKELESRVPQWFIDRHLDMRRTA